MKEIPSWLQSLFCWGLAGWRWWCIHYRERLLQRCQVLMCFCPGKVFSPWISVASFYSNPFCMVNPLHIAAEFHPPLPFAAALLFPKHRDWPQCPCNLVRAKSSYIKAMKVIDRGQFTELVGKHCLSLGQRIFCQDLKTNFFCVLYCSLNVTALSGPERAAVLTASTVLIYQMVRTDDFRRVERPVQLHSSAC